MTTSFVRGQHIRTLDGVRGLAVVSVVAYHLYHRPFSGGYIGVDLFFVLSGFLITSLLYEEHVLAGRISMRSFYARRAKRLFPALLLAIVLTAVGIVFMGHAAPTAQAFPDLQSIRTAMLTTIFYIQNWFFPSTPTPVSHTWSLAIEEQFYFVWPIIMVALVKFSDRARIVTTGVLAVAGLSLFSILSVTTLPIYTATYTRGGELLTGAFLAFLLQRPSHREWWAQRASWIAPLSLLIFLVLAQTTHSDGLVSSPPRWMYLFGFALVTLVGVGIIATSVCAPDTLTGRFLSSRPMVGLGVISYGIYVYHWGVLYYLKTDATGWSWAVNNVIGVSAVLGLSFVSYRYVELPLRKWSFTGWRRAFVPLGFAVAVAATLIGTMPPIAAPFSKAPLTTNVTAVNGVLPGASDVVGSLETLRGRIVTRIQVVGDGAIARVAMPLVAAYAANGNLEVSNDTSDQWGITASSSVPRSPKDQRFNVNVVALGIIQRAAQVVIFSSTTGDFVTVAVSDARYRAGLRRIVSLALASPSHPAVILLMSATPTLAGSQSERLASIRMNNVMREVAREHPSSVLAIGPSAVTNGSLTAPTFGPPNNAPTAPSSQWVRWRAPDGVGLCQPAVVRQAAVVLHVLAPYVGSSLAPRWWSQSWVNAEAFRRPSPCVADHP